MKLPRRIKCGSRTIYIGKPNWLTGLTPFGIDDLGTGVHFTMDRAATEKVIIALREVSRRQRRIECHK